MSAIIIVMSFLLGLASGILLLLFKYLSVSKENSAKEQKITDLNETINAQSKTQDMLKTEFENIASRVLEEKNSKISELNKQALENVVSPFKEKIDEFRAKVENIHLDEAKQREVLNAELKRLMELNRQVSEEANNLAEALKGESKLQGIWGEMSIERIFEAAGMIKDIHYTAQQSIDTGEGRKMPDYVVNLPENKHIVIDSKTSLTAYEKYYNTQDEAEKKTFLKEHIISIKKHIDELAEKNYQELPTLNQPDYVFMFIPLDPAAMLALGAEPKISEYAFKKNIVLITPSSLMATMKTVAYIWRQENQKKNVLEIAKQGGLLYDRFVDFVSVLSEADNFLGKAKGKTEDALKRLATAERKGDSLIGRAEKLKELGASVKKEIPEEMLSGKE